ncbi:MAG: cytochrome C oxidase subunit IV family protein [Bacteroidales bacterium]|nr:cytochrome C oxidase subunit IV family protein [Bacteroidales bacterium]
MAEKDKPRILPGDKTGPHIVSYRFHFGIWLGLIILTAMTVLVSVMGISLIAFSVITALFIASAKAWVVASYFMHLKWDHITYRIMGGIVMLLFLVFIILTGIDYLTR